jgi:hypothetical protein
MKNPIFVLICFVALSCNQPHKNLKEKQSDTIIDSGLKKDSLKSQILYEGKCSYSLSETDGWIAVASERMEGDNHVLVEYEPNEHIIHSAPLGIYSYVLHKEDCKEKTLNEFLEKQKIFSKERGEKVIIDNPILTKDNKNAIIIKYLIEQSGEYFATAYIEEPEYIISITYTSKDFNDYMNNYNSFKEIVKSYKYLGMVVIDETKNN